jgi:phage-related protein
LLQTFGFSLGMPYIRKIAGSDELWELRIQFGSNDYRVFYFHYAKGLFILLHAIKKKTDKTPTRDIATALSRIKKYYQRKEGFQ